VQAHGVDLVPAPAIQLPADRLEVEEGEEIIIPITLSGAFSHTVTVSHTLEDMTTTADADYVSLDTPGITFQTTQTHTITISTKDDDIPEQTEHMRLMLYDAVNASLQTTVVTITITDNDSDEESSLSPPPSRFRFESDTVLVDEGQTTVTITATMNITPTEPVTMTVRSRDSGGAGADKRSATAGVDYVLTDTSRTFSSDGMSQHFTLTITDDLEVEETEEVILELLDAANPALPAEARTTVIIEDNDTNTLPTLEFATDEQHEPFGTETITVAVRLSEPTSTTVTAECISGHSNIATTGTDTSYIATVEFAPETDTGYCTIPLASDNVRLNEAMPLFLREPVGAQLGSRDSTRLYIDYHPQLFYLPVVAKAQQ
jgi:hypothetical protein